MHIYHYRAIIHYSYDSIMISAYDMHMFEKSEIGTCGYDMNALVIRDNILMIITHYNIFKNFAAARRHAYDHDR